MFECVMVCLFSGGGRKMLAVVFGGVAGFVTVGGVDTSMT